AIPIAISIAPAVLVLFVVPVGPDGEAEVVAVAGAIVVIVFVTAAAARTATAERFSEADQQIAKHVEPQSQEVRRGSPRGAATRTGAATRAIIIILLVVAIPVSIARTARIALSPCGCGSLDLSGARVDAGVGLFLVLLSHHCLPSTYFI